jgi:hypothetical protein
VNDRIRKDPHVPLAQRPDLIALHSGSFLSSIDMALAVDEEGRWQSASEWKEVLLSNMSPCSDSVSFTGSLRGASLHRSKTLPPLHLREQVRHQHRITRLQPTDPVDPVDAWSNDQMNQHLE